MKAVDGLAVPQTSMKHMQTRLVAKYNIGDSIYYQCQNTWVIYEGTVELPHLKFCTHQSGHRKNAYMPPKNNMETRLRPEIDMETRSGDVFFC